MMNRRLLALIALLAACNDYPNQLVLTFDTDAPLPSAGGIDSLDGETPLFDRLRLDVLQPDGTPCPACSNDFAVTRQMFESGAVSIGIPLAASSGWTLRARLYLARFATNVEPNADSTIDVLVALPVAADNPGNAGVFLATDDVGAAKIPGTDTPSALGAQPTTSSVVGTWPPATRIGCDTSPDALPQPPNAVCVPGGAYWMGVQDGESLAGRDGSWHRLAVLSPFYVDADEVTVGAFRASGHVAAILNNKNADPGRAYCTFTSAPGSYEDLPVTCVNPVSAQSYCGAAGGALPTGTQFEWLATGLGRAPYVWGVDTPTCDAAIFDNCSTTGCFFGDPTPDACFTKPSPSPLVNANNQPIGGPVSVPCTSPGCPVRDVLLIGGAAVNNLAGNVTEFTGDRSLSETDSCYEGHILVDPTCPFGADIQLRGGAYADSGFFGLRGDYFLGSVTGDSASNVGFRCVYPATPLP
jgi:formylglycine-generating enzyme required for sulfatase activity